MLTLEIVNDQTGTDQQASYRYRVLVNGREVDRGHVAGHDRGQPWWALVTKIAAEAEANQGNANVGNKRNLHIGPEADCCS